MVFFQELPLLSLLIWLPIVGGIVCLAFARYLSPSCLKQVACLIACLELFLCAVLVQQFHAETWAMQWTEHRVWLPNFHIYYHLGVDGIALPLVVLSAFMTFLVVLATKTSTLTRMPMYLSLFLILQGLLCGVFLSMDAILFYVFWEALLIPMFLIIGIWGGKNRVYATLKFFLYTFLGSILLLVAILYCREMANTAMPGSTDVFSIAQFQTLSLSLLEQKGLFWAFLIAFAVKVPMWPVHTWLPDAHVEAPTGGSVILAAILLKVGGYGFLRFLLPIVPDAVHFYQVPMIILSLIAIVYIGLVAIMQSDLKKLIAYSSVSHMGFVTLGFFVGSVMGIEGAMIQLISHGFISGALFFCVGVLYDRTHTRSIKEYGGVVNKMPLFSGLFVLFALANLGLPGTSGFIGEFLVILATVKTQWLFAGLATLTLVLSASYTLWMTKRVIFGAITTPTVEKLSDINAVEKSILGALAIVIVLLGVWPAPVFQSMKASVQHLHTQAQRSKLFHFR